MGNARTRIVTLLCLSLALCACGQTEPGDPPARLANGVYEVLEVESRREDLPQPEADERIRVFDRRFVEGGSEEPPLYVLLRTTGFAPLDLAEPPSVGDNGGRPVLHVTLRPRAAEALETLTSAAKRAAVVVEDAIVTVHRVRIAIQGGRLQVSC